jgi:hypothetical protein
MHASQWNVTWAKNCGGASTQLWLLIFININIKT